MPAFAAAALPGAGGAPGRVFTLPAPFLPWLAPACILAGLALQLCALWLCRGGRGPGWLRPGLACAGALLVFAGAALDRDISVAVGEALGLAGMALAWRKG